MAFSVAYHGGNRRRDTHNHPLGFNHAAYTALNHTKGKPMKLDTGIVELLTLKQSSVGMFSIVGYDNQGIVVHRKRDLRKNDVLAILFSLNKIKRPTYRIRVFGDLTYKNLDEYEKPAIDVVE